ncbi:unnamed protein product [Hyaloperonospora brassicae]|uniref:RxLR effector candidate protein n=1 Tax=Hyaloperonospora brassicae TaxID=162125 RepID=A0AAV0T596_HYABA|nr:unnamed protein product [Hyaloperonospora brassicae]
MLVGLWRRTSPALSRGFTSAARKQTVTAAASANTNRFYYDRIKRKYPVTRKALTSELIDRATQYLEGRGLSRAQALRAISQHVMLVNYSEELMESKVSWFRDVGLCHDKINAIIMRHPNILGISIDKYEALVKWYLSHGVAHDKIPYLFSMFPQGVSYSVQENLDPKVDLLREIGCTDKHITSALTRSPQIFTLSVDRLRSKADYLVQLGVPRERLPHIVSSVPECLALTVSRLKETVDAMDEMFGAGAGLRALLCNCRIVMSNISVMRESFDFLISVGFTKERLEKNTRYIVRSVDRCLRPRVQYLNTKRVDVVSDITWILMPEVLFIEKYPDYAAFGTAMKAARKKK